MSWFNTTIVDHYEVLGVSRSTSIEEIKKVYRRLVRQHHPDVSHATTEEEREANTRRFDEVQQAYEWLIANHTPTKEKSSSTWGFDEEFHDTSVRTVDIIIDGRVPATLRYSTDQFGWRTTKMIITLEDARRLHALPEGEQIRPNPKKRLVLTSVPQQINSAVF
jgi:hypothetical protein